MAESSRQPPKADTEIIRRKVCPACNAQPGQPCTTPTDNSRKDVGWHHLSREY